MYELVEAIGRSLYIESPARIGLVKLDDNSVCLIDSGSDKDAGRRIRRILDEHGWTLSGIYSTHSHADHIGGNAYLQKQTGCKIYAPGAEQCFSEHPILEPSLLYGGCPPKALRHKFLMAEKSVVIPLLESSLPEGFSLIPLPGHFFDMVGYRTPDDVVYLADCLASKETLEKYGITFLYDVKAYLETLEMVKTLDAALFVPAHAPVTDDIAALCDYNISKVEETAEHICRICKNPSSTESIIQKMFQAYGLEMNFQQNVLVGSTIRSYLSYLLDSGKLAVDFHNNILVWMQSS